MCDALGKCVAHRQLAAFDQKLEYGIIEAYDKVYYSSFAHFCDWTAGDWWAHRQCAVSVACRRTCSGGDNFPNHYTNGYSSACIQSELGCFWRSDCHRHHPDSLTAAANRLIPRLAMSRWRHSHLILLCGWVMLAFALRVTTLDAQSLWRDETDALCYAFEFPHLAASAVAPSSDRVLNLPTACPPISVSISQEQSILQRLIQIAITMTQHNGPLYYFLLHGWVALAGQTPFALRYFSLVPGVLLIPLVYSLGQRLSRPQIPGNIGHYVSALAAGGIALSPYFIWYSQETKMYALVSALVVLSIYALRRALEGRALWWLVVVVATSLSVYLHILAALLIPLEFALLFLWWPRSLRKWIEGLVAFACLTVPYLPLLYWQLPMALEPAQTGYPSYSLPEIVRILAFRFSAGLVEHNSRLLLLMPLVILAIIGAILGPIRWRHKLALVTWVIWPVLALYVVSLRRPMFTDRYLIWIGPAMYLLAALGVLAIGKLSRWLAMASLIPSLIFFGWGITLQATMPIKSDFRAAAHFVEQYAEPDDLIIFQIPHVRYTFDFYYDNPFDWADGLYTNHGMTETEADTQMRATVGTHRVVWLVASEMPMWDNKLLVFNWLETHMSRAQDAHFALVDVYRYEAP